MWELQSDEDPIQISHMPGEQSMQLFGWSCLNPSHLPGYHSNASHALLPTSPDQLLDIHAEFREEGRVLWS